MGERDQFREALAAALRDGVHEGTNEYIEADAVLAVLDQQGWYSSSTLKERARVLTPDVQITSHTIGRLAMLYAVLPDFGDHARLQARHFTDGREWLCIGDTSIRNWCNEYLPDLLGRSCAAAAVSLGYFYPEDFGPIGTPDDMPTWLRTLSAARAWGEQ